VKRAATSGASDRHDAECQRERHAFRETQNGVLRIMPLPTFLRDGFWCTAGAFARWTSFGVGRTLGLRAAATCAPEVAFDPRLRADTARSTACVVVPDAEFGVVAEVCVGAGDASAALDGGFEVAVDVDAARLGAAGSTEVTAGASGGAAAADSTR
jgi:hypothetical protein